MEHTIIAQQFKFEVVSVHDRFDLLVKATLDRKLQYRVAKKEWPPVITYLCHSFFATLYVCSKVFVCSYVLNGSSSKGRIGYFVAMKKG